ncbi:DVUA0089 family protein [Aerosakkonemataceae cyanobacterium BLCC-F50]|uniref:DVUA0089 family protein n=1 Tax=Floridaenema flaviceps BLCC-F50 TaxID=3153642 RepID=A0ABV4XLY4_9CYAN
MAISTMMKKLSMATAGAAVVALGVVGSAQAATFRESGDAGQTLDTAQNVGGGITQILGNYQNSNADLFSFLWNGGAFSATASASFDTQLFLFNSEGRGVIANDDDISIGGGSRIATTLSQGLYYLGISGYNNDPVSRGGSIFTDNWSGVQTPTGSGGASPLSGWTGGGSNGSYQINISETASVPEPASTLGLLVLGSLGAGSMLKRKQQQKATVKA